MQMALVPRAVTVLLGATQAGKTSADAPDGRAWTGPRSGRVLVDGRDVTGVPVRERNVAMVYQQFINYPSLTVADNIASPLKLRGVRRTSTRRVRELAERAAHRPLPRPAAGRAVGRPAAARGAGARAGQGGAADAARRAAGQPRLQAARRTARGAGAAVRQRRIDRRLRHHRARRGPAARRLHRRARRRRTAAVRADRRGLPLAGSRCAWRAPSATRR